MATAKRVSDIVESLPIKVERRILGLNKMLEPTMPDITEINVDAAISIPFDSDLSSRSVHSKPIDDDAGDEMRKVIPDLVNLCLNQPASNTIKEIKETTT